MPSNRVAYRTCWQTVGDGVTNRVVDTVHADVFSCTTVDTRLESQSPELCERHRAEAFGFVAMLQRVESLVSPYTLNES
jgi:hypothetical protein